MTRTEVLHRFLIPLAVLEEYELWELCRPKGQDKAEQQYDDSDIERLSLIMTLNDIGFTKTEIKEYMRLQLSPENTKQERLGICRSWLLQLLGYDALSAANHGLTCLWQRNSRCGLSAAEIK